MSEHDRTLCDNCLREQYADFKHECIHEAMARNRGWLAKYSIHSWPRWDYSTDDATLTFSEDGVAKVICQMQVVGSIQGDSWEWSWGNSNFPDTCRRRMSEVNDFGEEKQWEQLTTLFLTSDEYVGWECASVACHVLNGEGAYRCPSSDGDGAVFVVVLSSEFVQ